MKTLITISILGLLAGASTAAEPMGSLDVSSSIVRAESHVTLNWNVEFPVQSVEELVEVNQETHTIVPKEDVTMTARILGSEYSAGINYGYVEGYYKAGSMSSYGTILEGWGDEVDPYVIAVREDVQTGEDVSMKFRGSKNGFKWVPSFKRKYHDWRKTGSGDTGILMLKNGDYVPNYAPAYDQSSAASFLAPYLSADGTTIEIGPRDLIVLVDVDSRAGDKKVDFQDFVILLTFETQS